MNAGPMSFRRKWLSTAIAFTVAACAAGTAQTVTVDVQGVPLNEVIEQLKLETEADIRADGLAQDVFAQPVTYTGTDVPLKHALREICGQVGLRLRTYGSARTLGRHFRLLAKGLNEAEPPTVQAGPYVVRLISLTRTNAMTLNFREQIEPLTFRNDLQLELEAEADTDRDAEALLTFHPDAAVTDDTGRTLEPARRELNQWELRGRAGHVWDQKLTGSITVALPAEEAATLATIERELVVATEVTPLRFEFDVVNRGQETTQGGYTLRLDSAEVRPGGNAEVGLTMTIAAQPTEPGRAVFSRLPDATCVLVLDDGTEVRTLGRSAHGTGGTDEPYTWEITCRVSRFPQGATPTKVVYSFFARSEETKRIPFKFENIPLPTWKE